VENLLCEVEKKHSTPADVRTSPKATRILRAPLGVNDGKGNAFISHQGDVQPSGFSQSRRRQYPARTVS
jgi:hypothetical protein